MDNMYADPVVMCMIRQKAMRTAVLIPAQRLTIFPKIGSVQYAAHPKDEFEKKRVSPLPRTCFRL